jgi:uncharacterized membrane protein YeaQ/YmgE (transglycosylase-associated protein family)
MGLLISIIVGLIAGWLAGVFMRGRGFGPIGDTVIGLVGGLIGGILASLIGIQDTNILGSILIAFIGAVILLSIAKSLKTNA